jgi:hypothetical protein
MFGHVSEGFDFLHARVLRQHGKDLREGGKEGEREERRTEGMKQLNKRKGGRESVREGGHRTFSSFPFSSSMTM